MSKKPKSKLDHYMDAQIPNLVCKDGLVAQIENTSLTIMNADSDPISPLKLTIKQAKELYAWMKENFE